MTIHHPYNVMVEDLFLEFKINEVINPTRGMPFIQPWDSMYIDSIHENRYGDAIWTRYHMQRGMQENGILKGSTLMVLESIEEDALEARIGDEESYGEALEFYANNSSVDGHPEIIELLMSLGRTEVSVLEARLEELRAAPSVCMHCGSMSLDHFKPVRG